MTWSDDYLKAVPVEPYFVEEAGIIWCADCRDILPHLPKVDMVLTDPPYGCQKEYANDDCFNISFHSNYWNQLNILTDEIIIFFGYQKNFFDFIKIVGTPRQFIIWCKPNAPMRKGQSYYHFSTEWILWFNNKNEIIFNMPPGELGRDYWRIPVRNGFLREGDWFHSASKPIELFTKLINVHAEYQSIILDPFLGSGTTAVAAKELGRRYIGIEIEEKYCEIAVKRLKQCNPLPFNKPQPKPEKRQGGLL